MRRPASDLDRAIKMSTEGMSIAGIARVLGVHPTTVRRWLEKAGAHAKRCSEEHLVVDEPEEVQIDELRVGGIQAAEGTWAWNVIEVTSRVGLATKVSRRLIWGESLSWVPSVARRLERVVLDQTQRRHDSLVAKS